MPKNELCRLASGEFSMLLTDLFDFIRDPILATTAAAICLPLLALLAFIPLLAILRRVSKFSAYLPVILEVLVPPLRFLMPLLALQAVWAAAPREYPLLAGMSHTTLLLIIAAATWLLVNALVGLRDAIALRYRADVADNLLARRIQTQTTVIMRTLSGLLILLGIAAGLMTFPDVRQVGASLLASAGLAGLVVGFAAKPTLGNIIAGLQIALSQPIRIDDVVIVEGEWGRVEEITGAYVVLKLWDERRLIVPLQWFIEHPFQNWTRQSAQILGTVLLWTDYRLPVDAVRREAERICKASPEWDGRVCGVQVTETSERAMQIRVLLSAADSGRNWDLRCRVREGLITFLQREHGEALPRVRLETAMENATCPP